MGLTMKERQSLVRVTADRYRKAGKKEKGQILDEFIQATGYNRSYGSLLLSKHGLKLHIGKTILIGDNRKRAREKRAPVYDDRVKAALKQIWLVLDCICSKRLKAALPTVLSALQEHGEIHISAATREKLLKISAPTIDRLLKPERQKQQLKGRSGTKPGTLLKHQIPIRTFSEWNENRPGFVEIDLVSHDGGNASGDFCQSLNLTDVCTGWTITRGVQNKAQVWVFEGLQNLRGRLPFKLLGIDSDNGSEFINAPLLTYCQREELTFTRSRPHRKNDNCYVEQKNYTIVRRTVGYGRYDSAQQLSVLNELYDQMALYGNFFLPVMKLTGKERIGSKVRKYYDQPRTPYQRVLSSKDVSESSKRRVRNQYQQLNPAQLKREIGRLQQKLSTLPVKEQAAARKRLNRAGSPVNGSSRLGHR